ncbi:hypothetical protein [Kineococcus sp. NPDC059986]|uniref:hypothetical protein n=1 Tax=Kineococcus sp. NPDC059986 TaxID=3155538 RepID=UPI00344FD2A1
MQVDDKIDSRFTAAQVKVVHKLAEELADGGLRRLSLDPENRLSVVLRKVSSLEDEVAALYL